MSRLIDAGRVFQDDNGDPLSGGTVTFYTSGTTTLKNTYADADLTVANSNPLTLGADGRLLVNVFGSGAYTVRVADVNGATIWSADEVANTADSIDYGGADRVVGTSTGVELTGAIVINGASLDETVQDVAGGMVSSNTETGIDITYDDATGKLNAVLNTTYLTNYINTTIPAASDTTAGKTEYATNAETETGTDTARSVTPAGLQFKLNSSVFESAEQTITIDGGTGSVSHGIGGVPQIFGAYLRCKVANVGYAVDDEVMLPMTSGGGAWQGGNVWANSTNIGYILSSDGAGGIYLYNKTTGVPTLITPGSWRVILRAVRF